MEAAAKAPTPAPEPPPPPPQIDPQPIDTSGAQAPVGGIYSNTSAVSPVGGVSSNTAGTTTSSGYGPGPAGPPGPPGPAGAAGPAGAPGAAGAVGPAYSSVWGDPPAPSLKHVRAAGGGRLDTRSTIYGSRGMFNREGLRIQNLNV